MILDHFRRIQYGHFLIFVIFDHRPSHCQKRLRNKASPLLLNIPRVLYKYCVSRISALHAKNVGELLNLARYETANEIRGCVQTLRYIRAPIS